MLRTEDRSSTVLALLDLAEVMDEMEDLTLGQGPHYMGAHRSDSAMTVYWNSQLKIRGALRAIKVAQVTLPQLRKAGLV